MKHEKLSQALNEISDAHIAEAAASKKRIKPVWFGAVAAILALAILITAIGRPTTASATGLLAAPEYPEMVKFSEKNWDEWRQSQSRQYNQPAGYADGTETFFKESITAFLNGSVENQVYSPLNVYMALAMLAEATGGESRQQLLELLGSDSIAALRTQAGHMWNAHYADDGLAACVLANSLWLDSTLTYKEDTVDALSRSYFASVYRGDLGSQKMNRALQNWLNDQTHGLLQEQAQGVELDDICLLALASAIYYNVQWDDDFNAVNNYDGAFHTPAGDVDTTYMYKVLSHGPYYEGEDFGAVPLSLRDGSRMWLILPDEGRSPAGLLESGHAMDMLFSESVPSTTIRVKLSLPKFDIVSDTDLIPQLQALGITDVFQADEADFSPLLGGVDTLPFVSQVSHAARVAVDEKGVTAAAYTVIEVDGAGLGTEDELDFTLDRPFLFVIESRDGIPLFTGIVNQP